MHDFTPWSSLAGGALIGLAASLLLLFSGRVAGVSGLVGGALLGRSGGRALPLAFLAGLLAAGAAFALVAPGAVAASPRGLGLLAAAGLVVGIGTRLGSGCTSGHGVCGISRLSPRSLAATAAFIVTGAFTVAIIRWVGGAP